MIAHRKTTLGLGILVVLSLVIPLHATAKYGYTTCRYTSATTATCCNEYSNGHHACQNYYWHCEGNTQDENRRCYWRTSGGMYEPEGCFCFENPSTGELICTVPEPVGNALNILNREWDIGPIPDPLGVLP